MTKLIRVLTFLVVLAVASFAFIVSYEHIYSLGKANGQFGSAARLLPLSIDGLIVAASLVLLEAALSGRGTPVLARAMLWAGVAATLASNALYGRSWGLLGVLVSTLPAASFVGAIELLFGMVRSAHAVPEQVPDSAPVPGLAELFAPELAQGQVPGVRTIKRKLSCGQPRAQEVRTELEQVLQNGHRELV